MNNCRPFLLLPHSQQQNFWVILFAFFVVLFLGVYLFKIFTGRKERFFILLIVSGAFWNIIDSIGDGCVSDPFNFFSLFHFNFADVLVTCGSLTLFVIYLIKNSNAEK
jgi:lipoprotein signal peptidase